MIFLWLIGARKILLMIESMLVFGIIGSAFKRKRYLMYTLFVFCSLAELPILDGWIRILFPMVYETKVTIVPALRLGIEVLELAVLVLLRCWGWKKCLKALSKTFMGEVSLDQMQDLDQDGKEIKDDA